MEKANYRKMNDHSHNSSTYHKKDGTSIRAKLKEDLKKECKMTHMLSAKNVVQNVQS